MGGGGGRSQCGSRVDYLESGFLKSYVFGISKILISTSRRVQTSCVSFSSSLACVMENRLQALLLEYAIHLSPVQAR